MKKLITPKQLSKLHTILSQTGMTEHKRQLIYEVSAHRTTSSKELTYTEVNQLIDYLEDLSGLDKMRRKIFALAYDAGIIYGDTPDDKKMNAAKLNKFILDRGTVKKELSRMNKAELSKTASQFASIVRHNIQSKQSKAVNQLLDELKLEVK